MAGLHRHCNRNLVLSRRRCKAGAKHQQRNHESNQRAQRFTFHCHLTGFPFSPLLHYIVSERLRRKAIENESNNLPVRENHIWVSRRLIYGQAALLGVSAATFFMLGMMVGNLTSSGSTQSNVSTAIGYVEDCRVSGIVTWKSKGRDLADTGAVVILLPRGESPEKRQAPGLIMPETFVALDNPTIEAIYKAGGTVVRADSDGKFDLLVDQGREYRLLVVSKNRRSVGKQLTEQQTKVLESWFAPAEKLIRDNDFQWVDVSATSDKVDTGMLAFP